MTSRFALFAALGLSLALPTAHAAKLTVFAAASLTDAFSEIGKNFDAASGHTTVFQFAGSQALRTQLDFIWFELTKYSSYGLASLEAATTFTAAVAVFQDRFEGCGDCNNAARLRYAKDAYSRYA